MQRHDQSRWSASTWVRVDASPYRMPVRCCSAACAHAQGAAVCSGAGASASGGGAVHGGPAQLRGQCLAREGGPGCVAAGARACTAVCATVRGAGILARTTRPALTASLCAYLKTGYKKSRESTLKAEGVHRCKGNVGEVAEPRPCTAQQTLQMNRHIMAAVLPAKAPQVPLRPQPLSSVTHTTCQTRHNHPPLQTRPDMSALTRERWHQW